MDQRSKEKEEKMMIKIKPSDPVDYRWILAGTLFFINPNISVVDILPDFIGAVLMIIGFRHLAEIDDRARDAQKTLGILALTSAARCLSLLFLTNADGTVWHLIFTFCFGIGEAGLLSYAMCKLYAGLIYQAMRKDCPAVYTGFTALNGLTVLVAVLKNLLCFLPELTALSSDYGSVDGMVSGGEQISEFIYTVLTGMNLAVVVSYGIGWWIYIFKFFRTVGHERGFLERIEKAYMAEVGSKHEVLTYRKLKGAGVLLSLGIIFLFPLRFDGNDWLPDFIAAVFLLAALLWLRGLYPGKGKGALIAGSFYGLVSVCEWIYELIFNKGMNIDHDVGYYDSVSVILLRYPEKLGVYYGLVALSILKYLLLAWFLVMIWKFFVPIIHEHTGSAYELSAESGRVKSAKIHKKLEGIRKILTGLSFVTAGAGIFFRVFRMFSGSMLVEYTEALAVLAFFAVTVLFLSKLEEGIDNKYYMAK